MKNFKLLTLKIIFFILFLPSISIATPSSPLWIHDSDGDLGKYDLSTNTVQKVGTMGNTMTDIAFDPSGDLYGLTFSSLYKINKNNANTQYIGNHNISSGNALVFGTDGTLYASGDGTTNLYSIDKSNGDSTLLFDTGFTSSGDLAFNDGKFYLSSNTEPNDTLVKMNLTNQSSSQVGNIGYNDVYGLATGDDGVLYGLSGTNAITVSTNTGSGSFFKDYSGQDFGASYGSSFITESQPIPEPTTWLLFGTGLLGLAGISRKKFFNKL